MFGAEGQIVSVNMAHVLKKLFVALLPLGTAAVVILLVAPEYKRIADARLEKERAEAELRDKQALVEKIEGLEAQFREVKDAAEKVAEIVPPEPNIPALLVELPALALRYGMSLNNITFLVPPEGRASDASGAQGAVSPYRALQVTMSLKGTYETLKLWLRAVEKDLRLMDVSSVAFSGGGETRGVSDYDISLQLYYGLTL